MTTQETQHMVYLTVTEINKALRTCKSKARKNHIIKEACNKNEVSEKHVRKIGGYDR